MHSAAGHQPVPGAARESSRRRPLGHVGIRGRRGVEAPYSCAISAYWGHLAQTDKEPIRRVVVTAGEQVGRGGVTHSALRCEASQGNPARTRTVLSGSAPYYQAHIPCLGGRPCHVYAPCCSSVLVCSWSWGSFGAKGYSPPLKALLEAHLARGL